MSREKASKIEEVYNIVEKAAKSRNNYSGYGAWTHHILPVIKYSKILAKKLNANSEVVELAALLHDYSTLIEHGKYLEDHHIHSKRIASKLLHDLDYKKETIDQVLECIETHRASGGEQPSTLEAKIVASADAMAHIMEIPSLFEFAYSFKKMGIDEGSQWILEKIKKSHNKMMPEAQALVEEKYQAALVILSR